MSTLVSFTPSTTSVFSFSPTLSGTQYNATVTFNVFGQRFFLNLSDLSGNLILATGVVSSGPSILASFTWDTSLATVSTTLPHNVPIGTAASIAASGTDTGFDGLWTMLSTGPTTLTYSLPTDPNATPSGAIEYQVNLANELGTLLFHYDSMVFEYE